PPSFPVSRNPPRFPDTILARPRVIENRQRGSSGKPPARVLGAVRRLSCAGKRGCSTRKNPPKPTRFEVSRLFCAGKRGGCVNNRVLVLSNRILGIILPGAARKTGRSVLSCLRSLIHVRPVQKLRSKSAW